MLAVRIIVIGAIMGLVLVGTVEGILCGAFMLPFLEVCFGEFGLKELCWKRGD